MILRRSAVALGLLAVVGAAALAQQRGFDPFDGFGPGQRPPFDGEFRGGYRGERSSPGILPGDRAGVPDWEVDERFEHDVFTFVRVEYDSYGGRRGWGGRRWLTDWPDSDLNFSYRLQQLTSLKVNPDPISLRLTDDRLFDYPFLYLIEPGSLVFSDSEVEALRRYLLNGGFLMIDDFWGDAEYQNLYRELRRVFPDREPIELDLDHPVFRIVYRLTEKPQVPSIHSWYARGVSYERGHDTMTPHYQGIFDDQGRMVVIICHNTDLGDGWEREGEDPAYFEEFSEKKAYPMGINIIAYAMTH